MPSHARTPVGIQACIDVPPDALSSGTLLRIARKSLPGVFVFRQAHGPPSKLLSGDEMSKTARIEVFRTGTFTPMEGASITYTAADLKAMADAYDYATAPAPIVVGHPKTDDPAYGWAERFEFDPATGRLHAVVGEINPAFSDAVKNGSYKKISLSFFRPDNAANPVPGTWYPKHIGFLGGAAPAVTGLKNVQFSAVAEDVTFSAEFGERGFEQTASILQALREFLIEKFGRDDADKALPAYQIEWLGDIEVQKPATSLFSAPEPKQEPSLSKTDPAFAEREAKLAANEAAVSKRLGELAHAEHVSFADSLVNEGKLIPASKDKLVSILDKIADDTLSVSFAAGEAPIAVAKALRDLLADQPKVISFGRQDLPEPGNDQIASFASDGKPVDSEQLARHQKALAYQGQHPGTAYLDAVRAVA